MQREAAAGQGPGAEAVPGTLEGERVFGAPGEGQEPEKPRCSSEVLRGHTANSPSGEASPSLRPWGPARPQVSRQLPADSSAPESRRPAVADGMKQNKAF